jgi:hypothetical protein
MCRFATPSHGPTVGQVARWHFAAPHVNLQATFLRVAVLPRSVFLAAVPCSTPCLESFIQSLFTPNVGEIGFFCHTKAAKWSFQVLVPTLSTSMANEPGSNTAVERDRFPMMRLRTIFPLLLFFSLPVLGQGSSTSSLELETTRFVRAYRIDKVAHLGLAAAKQGVEAAVAQGKMSSEAANCFLATYSYDAYMATLTQAVSLHFRSSETLKSINDFFESAAGTKMLDQLLANKGKTDPTPLQFSDAERMTIARFDASQPSGEFAAFINRSLPNALNDFRRYVLSQCTADGFAKPKPSLQGALRPSAEHS